MSFPNIPDVDSTINITVNEAVNLLLASIAFEELGLSHIINAEAEKVQYILGTLAGQTAPEPPTINKLLEINKSVEHTMRTVLKEQMLLQFKLEDTICITTTSTTSTTTTTTNTPVEVGSAWSDGIRFGQGNAQYTTLISTKSDKAVFLDLKNDIPIGIVLLYRTGNNLSVTFATVLPYIMNQVHLYVDDVAPINSDPKSFPHQYSVIDPFDYFTIYTFDTDVSAFAGETIYVAAHAHILK